MEENRGRSTTTMAGVPSGYARAGIAWVGEKISRFWQKRSPNCDFFGLSTFLSSRNLTGGSGVRGKAGPIG
jgi:hypothetical protein